MSTPLLEVQDLTFSFARAAGTKVFSELHFSLAAGEIVSLLGASGIGKSTLLRVLAGLYPPTHGNVRLAGTRRDGPSPEITLAFQDPRLLPWLTLEANVAFGLDFTRQPALDARTRKQRVDDAIERVGLTHARKLLPSQLSGGMAQRAAFARCLTRRPRVLLLDEPFAALDEVTRQEMQTLLLGLARENELAILLSTHDIDEALTLSDRVVLLGGRPARLARTWRLDSSAAGAARVADEALDPVRGDIVRALSDLRRPAQATESSHV